MHKLRHLDGVGIRLSLIAILSLVAVGLAQNSQTPPPAAATEATVAQPPTTLTAYTAFPQDEEAAPAETETEVAPTESPASESTDEAAADTAPVEGSETEEEEPHPAGPMDEANAAWAIDNVTLFICAILVLFMQAGFAMVEVGLNSPRNAVNILYKNLMDLCVGALLFFIVGFGLMYPGSYDSPQVFWDGFLSFGGVGIYEKSGGTFTPAVDWFFQAAFAATAATIVSGAVAGRMKFSGYLIYSAILTALIYPISGYWKWGGGWLTQFGTQDAAGDYSMAFQDFAGSAVVHGVGGFAGLAGALILGPRTGRFVDGKSRPMPGHNLVYAALGVFVLWVGWYGFNPGSQLVFSTPGDIKATMVIAVNTTLAAAAGGVVATIISWIFYSKPDLSLSLNGVLGGLVGITACCDCFSHELSIVVGGVAGLLVIIGVVLLERLQIDDPVGAWPVHGLCGIWGCMAIGVLPNSHLAAGNTTFMIQLIGTFSIVGWAFVTMAILFLLLKVVGLLRVTVKDEEIGLDVVEHGMHAYYDTETRVGK